MFPASYGDKGYYSDAKKICESCPVSKECLDYALEFPALDMHGVWAGLTPNQLAREQRVRGIKPSRPSTSSIINGGFDRLQK